MTPKLIIVLIFIAFVVLSVAIKVLWNIFIAHRPLKTDKFYDLPIIKVSGMVLTRDYLICSTVFDSYDHHITFITDDEQLIIAYITPTGNIEEHRKIVSIERNDKGVLYYRKGKRVNYFEGFEKIN